MKINKKEKQEVKETLKRKHGSSRILGNSNLVNQLREQIRSISLCDVSVLIIGESGTGKELAARAVHYLSSRCHHAFVAVNCGAIPENLFENELFGHRKGAFTDASFHQDGVIKEAEGGTLFLDEIGVITPYIQTKLLRLLQEKEYKPLGDSKTRKANVRIVAATNKDLQTMVKEETFREDLFYRLDIVSLSIPPLRERKEDIPLLLDHFITKYSLQYRKSISNVSKEAMAALLSYSWPGNIRELENKIQHAIVMNTSGGITLSELGLPNTATRDRQIIEFEEFKQAKHRAMEKFEKNYLLLLMTACGGDVHCAARRAGKSRTGFWNLLAKHNLHPSQFMGIMGMSKTK